MNLSTAVLQLKLNVPRRGLVNSSWGSKNSCRGPQNRSWGYNLPNLEEPGPGPARLTLTTVPTVGNQAFSVAGAIVWSSLPLDIIS
jgi:hypothetical protein